MNDSGTAYDAPYAEALAAEGPSREPMFAIATTLSAETGGSAPGGIVGLHSRREMVAALADRGRGATPEH